MTDLFRLGRPNRFTPRTQLPQDRTAGFDIIESSGYIADGVVDTDQVAAGAITVTEIADDSISTPKLQANAVIVGKLEPELQGAQLFYTDFSDISNWANYSGGGTLTSVASSGGQAGGYIGRAGDNSGDDQYWAHRSDINIPFDPNALYRYHIRARITAGTGVMYAGVVGVGYDGITLENTSGSPLISSQHYIGASNQYLTSSWQDFTGYFKGTAATGTSVASPDASAPGSLHTDVRYFRPMFLVNYANQAGTTEIDVIDITRIDISHVANSAGNVVINSSGITITDGALTIQDEFGKSSMTGGGFSGSWEDYIGTGVRNGSFADSIAGVAALGRTSDVPYWYLRDVTGTTTFTSAVGLMTMRWTGTNHEGSMYTDSIRVKAGVPIVFQLTEGNPMLAASTVERIIRVYTYGADGAYIEAIDVDTKTYTGGTSLEAYVTPQWTPNVYQLASTVEVHRIRVDIRVRATSLSLGEAKYQLYQLAIAEQSMAAGTSFPTNPSTNQRFYRTDLALEFYYVSGSTWRCTCLHTVDFRQDYVPFTATARSRANLHLFGGGSDIFVEDMYTSFYVTSGTALGASHKWVGTTTNLPSTETITIASGSSAVWRSDEQVVDQLLGSTNKELDVVWTKTGTPGDLHVITTMTYRIQA